MSTIKSSAEHLTLNADGASKDIKFQANGVEKASISSAGAFTSTTIDATKLTGALPAISGAALTGVGVAGITSAADATAIKIDSSERVAIGNTDAGNYYSSADNLVVYDSTNHAGITIASGGANKTGNIYFADGTSGTTEYEGYIQYDHGVNSFEFGTNHATQLVVTSDGRGLSQFTAKAWANFDGEGTIALRDSHNVSSLTDHGVGDYTISFTNNLTSNYVTVGNARWIQKRLGTYYGYQAASNSRFAVCNSGTQTQADSDTVMVMVFGD